MEISRIEYRRTQSRPNYCSESVGVEITIHEGDNIEESMETARAFVALHLGEMPSEETVKQAKAVMRAHELSGRVAQITGPAKAKSDTDPNEIF